MGNQKLDELSTIIRSKHLLIKVIVGIILVVVVVLVIFISGYNSASKKHQSSEDEYEQIITELEKEVSRLSEPVAVYEEASREVNISKITSEIRQIGELATVEYLYTDAGKFEEAAQVGGKDLPFSFTTKSFIAKWDGTLKAGIDISRITAEVDQNAKEIIVHIPHAQILSHEIETDSMETLDENDGLFNRINIEDVREFDAVSKDAMEQRAIENGILDTALENAQVLIEQSILRNLEGEYTVRFELE